MCRVRATFPQPDCLSFSVQIFELTFDIRKNSKCWINNWAVWLDFDDKVRLVGEEPDRGEVSGHPRQLERGYVRSVVRIDWNRQVDEDDDIDDNDWHVANVTCTASNLIAGQTHTDTQMFYLERPRPADRGPSCLFFLFYHLFSILKINWKFQVLDKMTKRRVMEKTGPATADVTPATSVVASWVTPCPFGTILAATINPVVGSTSSWSTDCGKKLSARYANRANRRPR